MNSAKNKIEIIDCHGSNNHNDKLISDLNFARDTTLYYYNTEQKTFEVVQLGENLNRNQYFLLRNLIGNIFFV